MYVLYMYVIKKSVLPLRLLVFVARNALLHSLVPRARSLLARLLFHARKNGVQLLSRRSFW